jgi:hypothetical protein
MSHNEPVYQASALLTLLRDDMLEEKFTRDFSPFSIHEYIVNIVLIGINAYFSRYLLLYLNLYMQTSMYVQRK